MAYFDKYGVEFSDDRKTLIRCPKNFTGSYLVPNGVEDISNFAYKDCKNITEIIISNSVVRIGEEAFYDCTCLNSIVIEYNIKHIGGYAFLGCEALTYVHITYIKSWCEICLTDLLRIHYVMHIILIGIFGTAIIPIMSMERKIKNTPKENKF